MGLDEENHNNSLAEIVDAIVAQYNKLKGFDTKLSRKRMLNERTMCYVNGFLLILVGAAAWREE